MTSEFIDTYSDDMSYLLEARSAILTHPLRVEIREVVDACTCRLAAVLMVGNVELMLSAWQEKDYNDILKSYFAKGRKNGERIDALCTAFKNAGITVDEEVFNDYLAVKYIRNSIVHTQWHEQEREWVAQRGFPTDVRALAKEHLDRMMHVNQSMMFYIAMTSFTPPGSKKKSKLLKFGESGTRQEDATGILCLRDLDRIIWNNLERIHTHVHESIKRVATSEQYSPAKDWSGEEIQAMLPDDRKRLFYFAALRASENNDPSLLADRPLASEALGFWQEYWQRAIAGRGLNDAEIGKSLDVLQSQGFATLARERPELLTLSGVLDHDSLHLLDEAVSTTAAGFTNQELAAALRIGRLAYELVPNLVPVWLLTIDLPILDPENTSTYLREAQRALTASRLNGAWYGWVERRQPPKDQLGFYELMNSEFAKRAIH